MMHQSIPGGVHLMPSPIPVSPHCHRLQATRRLPLRPRPRTATPSSPSRRPESESSSSRSPCICQRNGLARRESVLLSVFIRVKPLRCSHLRNHILPLSWVTSLHFRMSLLGKSAQPDRPIALDPSGFPSQRDTQIPVTREFSR